MKFKGDSSLASALKTDNIFFDYPERIIIMQKLLLTSCTPPPPLMVISTPSLFHN
jgi:hypothetical protein